MEDIGNQLRGIYRDVLLNSNQQIVHDSGWKSNTIVAQCRILLAAFMKNDDSQGIQYLAVGSGRESWDEKLDQPDANLTDLEAKHTPVLNNLDVNFLYENGDNKDNPTPRLEIKATLEPGYPPPVGELSTYPLREFGLFGKFGDKDYMINCIRHPVIHKDATATLIRTIRLYF